MGFGAVLASGDQNELLPEELMGCVTEVRVEQFLDRPSEFAVRFEEDLEDGEPRVMNAAELATERRLTVAVPAGGDLRCLVHGPITGVRSSVQLGGPGSWFEVHGQDRRVELDRVCFRHAWEGRASEAAETILGGYGFTPSVERTTRVYGERDGTLNQRGSDLAFVGRIARLNNLCFWLDYGCSLNGLDPVRRQLTVRETANLRSSPPRGDAPPAAAEAVQLVPTTALRLRVHTDRRECQNVTAFHLEMNVERPTRFEGSAVDGREVREERTAAEDRQPPVRRDGATLADLTGQERQICVTAPGDPGELQPRAEAALTEAGWFLNATASTTAHLLGGVLTPHEVIEVEGLGRRHSGAYQVAAVTHVINAADHYMDLQLRRNAVGRT